MACRLVIDLHRKLVEYIDNATIFYHEPYASSACEMVTELVQYLSGNIRLTRLEAEALLAGIMLDTKNFVSKAGVRTFGRRLICAVWVPKPAMCASTSTPRSPITSSASS